ncbi:hypothetical protein [Dysgonomonas sp. 511]|uniref:hypothetical protein n=1 Tax=Dysgonomonas sp. 511 TaxID=2302930 RepID=UPI0013D16E3F|nr:hypothetical protein [Dysgonomonas sp. 511]NDV79426.1 hypothetical protein [Dysgonomonas sp. 511]
MEVLQNERKRAEEAMIKVVEDFFLQFGIKYKRHTKTSLLLVRYFNFRLKYILVGKRKMQVSKELSTKILTHQYRNDTFSIFDKIISGEDINPFQSKESFNADYHDSLFNDWKIHHLHLSTKKKNPTDYFNERTGPLLFILFTDDTAYALDIKNHNDKNVWSDTDLIHIIQKNWNYLISASEVPNITWSPDLSDKEIGILRKKGYTFGINVDEKSYLYIGHGQTSSGDNLLAIRMANEVLRWLAKNYELIDTDINRYDLGLKEQLHI